jgi:glycosyltransferase involved in cell wall biosynthesis
LTVAGGCELSVVIAARNEAAVLPAQLEAVLAQECDAPWEVIVADNGSTDRTQDVVRAHAARDARLRLVDASTRPGTAHARNHAVAAASGGYLVFTDADDVVAPGWLAGMEAELRRSRFAAARLEHVRLNPAWTVAFRGGDQTTDVVRRSWGPPWPNAYGTSLGIARELHEAVGGFDESIGPCGDMDYCFRVQRETGVPLRIAGAAVVHYRHRTTLRATFRQGRAYGRDAMTLQRRYADVWREPEVPLPAGHLALRAARRLLLPDEVGGRQLKPVRTRAALGAWAWQLGGDVGRWQDAREQRERLSP